MAGNQTALFVSRRPGTHGLQGATGLGHENSLAEIIHPCSFSSPEICYLEQQEFNPCLSMRIYSC
jgi:hypothetical protein